MPITSPQRFRFGDGYELDLGAYELRRDGRTLKLPRIPMEVLRLLLEQRGNLVSRDEIIERIWGREVFVDTDNSINAAIRKIRVVLKDDADEPRFIQTVPAKGYRFLAAVMAVGTAPGNSLVAREPVAVSDPIQTPETVGTERIGPHLRSQELPNSGAEGTRSKKSFRWALLSAIVLVAAALTVTAIEIYARHHRVAEVSSAPTRVLLAVLPFENLTGDPGQEYFSDGLTEEMIAQLGNLDPQHLGVIARTSIMHYKDTTEKLDQIGNELGVQYVLEGSVRRSSDKVRITAQLIQVKDQSHVWARQYDRELSNVLALQGEIAQEVSQEIPLRPAYAKAAVPAHHPALGQQEYEAYDLYLKGRFFWNKRTAESLREAIECFQQAVAKDPNYGRAYAGLADSYALLSGYSQTPQTESMPKARTAALKALELDEGLAEAHTSLALIKENYDWDWKTAEKEYRRAIELDPNYATAHHWYAEFLSWQGRFDEAFAESERARQLDPLSLIIASDHAAILIYSRQYDRAIEQCRTFRGMEPNFPRADLVVIAYAEKGQFANALANLATWEDGPWSMAWHAYIYGRAGQKMEAQRVLQKLQQLSHHQYVGPEPFLLAYIGMDDKDAAFTWFERAYSGRSNLLTSLKVNPAYDPLRSDPRFQDLMRRVGLAN